MVFGRGNDYLAGSELVGEIFQYANVRFGAVLKRRDYEISLLEEVCGAVCIAAEFLSSHRVDAEIAHSVLACESLYTRGKSSLYAAYIGDEGLFVKFGDVLAEEGFSSLRKQGYYHKVKAGVAACKFLIYSDISQSRELDIVVDVTADNVVTGIFFQCLADRASDKTESDNEYSHVMHAFLIKTSFTV